MISIYIYVYTYNPLRRCILHTCRAGKEVIVFFLSLKLLHIKIPPDHGTVRALSYRFFTRFYYNYYIINNFSGEKFGPFLFNLPISHISPNVLQNFPHVLQSKCNMCMNLTSNIS
ncbi:hypothetical protein TNCT_634361 [Trichonephila clavata]|uniref:Uncharacterized protein n=1 Tax=Trichonephila clavata TaxID=2740835 RepID=A0A8X6HYZ7_TRICU|nr:hypothetical protein TNCT_634361 [Trichonephila clavata]